MARVKLLSGKKPPCSVCLRIPLQWSHFYSKANNQQSEKIICRTGVNTLSHASAKGLIIRIYYVFIQLNSQKKKKLYLKMNKGQRYFSVEDKQMAIDKQTKRYSANNKSISSREIKIKISLRCHLTPVRIAIHKRTKKQQAFGSMWKKESSLLEEM